MMRNISRVLVTAGPTRERLDSVRFISNFSSGTMGYEIARAALRRGFRVTLISGPTDLRRPRGARFIGVESASEMADAVKRNLKRSDCVFMASAVSDWRPLKRIRGKIKKGRASFTLKLTPNPDILTEIGKRKNGRIVAGFALESGNVVTNAARKLREKNADFIVANKIGTRSPFGEGRTDVTIIDRYGGLEVISSATKGYVAGRLLKKAEALCRKKG
jgi:phosphopantothenoylcysteine decarboxylase/phosphopantothenate--cysteine ligase